MSKVMDNTQFSIEAARTPSDLSETISLFREYAASLGFDLAFQSFDVEMASMPGKYAPPKGELLLARDKLGISIGCVGLRPLGADGVCEMKRLYVAPAGRGTGVGSALVAAVIRIAEDLGYHEMRLDTIPNMIGALKIYQAFGFVDIEAYYQTPLEGTRFLSLKLRRNDRSHASAGIQ